MICGCLGCLLCCVTVAAGVVPDARGAETSLLEALGAALEANRQLSELAQRQRAEIAELREQNARLLERDAVRDAELEELRADFAVLQRMLFGRSSEKSPPGPPAAAAVMMMAARAGSAGAAPGRSGVRGRGRAGGITRIFPGSRCSGTFPAAGTAARSAGSRSRRWGITGPGSSWTGR